MSRRGALYSGMCTDLNDEFWNRDGDEPDGPFKHVFETYVLAWILSTLFTGDGFIAFPTTSFKPRRPERTEPRGNASSGRTHGTGSTAHPTGGRSGVNVDQGAEDLVGGIDDGGTGFDFLPGLFEGNEGADHVHRAVAFHCGAGHRLRRGGLQRHGPDRRRVDGCPGP